MKTPRKKKSKFVKEFHKATTTKETKEKEMKTKNEEIS